VHSSPEIQIVEYLGDIILTPLFWDCECEHNFIHPKSQPTCSICEAEVDEQPDSRVDEILSLHPELLTAEQRAIFAQAVAHLAL
jgi:hypothetical protein